MCAVGLKVERFVFSERKALDVGCVFGESG